MHSPKVFGAVALGMTLAAGATACTKGTDSGIGAAARPVPVELTITPAGKSGKVRPESAIEVAAVHGTVQNVTVTTKGTKVEGDLSADRTKWKSRWTLDPGTEYRVTATGAGKDGKARTVTSAFSTAKAKKTIDTYVEAPFNKEKVGVGIPIVLRFDREVENRAAVERALEVHSDKPVDGAWHWFGDQLVVFRTKSYWPAHTKARFTAHLSGVRAARNVYGDKNINIRFEIGDQHITKASAKRHTMTVYKNGKKVRKIPVSMGRGGLRKYTTTNGMHLTMDKENPVVMDSSTVGCPPGCPDYYKETVYWTVRISNSGEYVHSAPWSVGSQGYGNVSHGCVNISPSNATWFYRFSYRGDPYIITGTRRELEPDNGWGYWQMPWRDWVKGSALKRSVRLTP